MIRLATSQDAVALENLATAAYSKYLDTLHTPPDALLLDYEKVAEEGNTYVIEVEQSICGMVTCIEETDFVILRSLAVLPGFQGKGIGRQLADFVEAEALSRGFEQVRLWTREQMHDNIHFYTQLGYEITHRKNSEDGSRVFFKKTVSPNIPSNSQSSEMVKT